MKKVILSSSLLLALLNVATAAQINLQTYLGWWVSAANGGGQAVMGNGGAAGSWETFTLVDSNGGTLESGDQITIQAPNGQYFCAEGGGGQNVVANRDSVGGWEVFRIYRSAGSGTILSGDQVYIQASNNQYLCAEDGGGSVINANRDNVAGWETFTITLGGGGGGTPLVSGSPSATSIQVGQTISFPVSATCDTGLNELGLEACNSSGVAVTNLGLVGTSGTSASNTFYWTSTEPGTFYFDTYAWNVDRSQLTRTQFVTVTVTASDPGIPQVSGAPSATTIQVGQTISFPVSATCGTGLNELGLEACDAGGTAVTNLGMVGASGTSANHTFSWTATSPGMFYFDIYAWNADRTHLTRTRVANVTVTGVADSTWIDINGDGIKDEIIASNSPRFSYSIYSWSTDYYDYWGYNPNDYWSWYTYDNFWSSPWWENGYDQNIWSLFSWNASWYFYPSYSYTVTYSDINFSMNVDAGYDYRIYSGNQGDPSTWSTVPGLSGDLNFPAGGAQSIYISGLNQDSIFGANFFFVRIAKPLGTFLINDNAGNVLAGETGNTEADGDASITAPSDGEVTINPVDLAGNAISTLGHHIHWTVFDYFGNLVRDVFGDNIHLNILSLGEVIVFAAVDASPPKRIGLNLNMVRQLNYPRDDGNTEGRDIPSSGIAYITPLPAMPDLQATASPPIGAMSVSWRMVVTQERSIRNGRDNFSIPSSGTRDLAVGTPWHITGDYPPNFFGGTCTIHYQYKDAQNHVFGDDHTYVIKIHGKNPADDVAKAYIQDVDHGGDFNFWFLWAIVQHESRGGSSGKQVYNQFVATGSMAGMPDWGSPDGWGLGHVENTDTHATYNWKANIDAAVAVLKLKQIVSNTFFNGVARKYGSGEPSSPPTDFVPPGTNTHMSARDSYIMTAYNGMQGTPTMVVTNVNNQSETMHSTWIYNPSAPSGQRWGTFHENSPNAYVRTVIHNEYEGALEIQAP